MFKRQILLIAALLVLTFLQTNILISPSHPFADENGDGIDDFEQNIGLYQDPEEKAKIYGVTFPITELGGCGDYLSCRTFCEDPLNSQACVDYGKSKGFYEGESDEKVQQVLARAKTELGCDSFEACQNFCEVAANYDKCHTFAQAVDLTGGYVDDPAKAQIVTKASEVLGCTSANSCQSFCEQEANRQKCADFAKQVGLRGGEHQVGPGGCTSETTCKSFCSDPNNFQICKGFHDVAGGQFSGPGGCNSEESCRTYCQQNEAACSQAFRGPGTGQGGPGGYNPAEMCNRTPNCGWTNNGCQCGYYGETQETAQKAGEYAAYCQANPDKCAPGQPGSFDSSQMRQEFEDYCSKNPDKCQPPTTGGTSGTYGDPATECARYGCSWTNNSCQCSGFTPYSYPTPAGGSCPAGQYIGPGGYCIPEGGYSYPSPSGPYSYPSPSYYSYPTPGSYSYPTPGSYYTPYGTPSYGYPTPGSYSYPSPYGTPSYSYPSPSYGTPSYGTPEYSYPSPYGTPEYSYPTPYGTPAYATPASVAGASTSLFDIIWNWLTGN
ncbi:hypothetical protein HY385_00365 [Candidatus Daviesbacteria bacterium]|nr:hypothetical protein [Candidatus Daviesbacteria bacterium]